MSKNIVIQEGGVGKQLTADKLKTNLAGGGTCLWVPEDETMLGTKYITEDGTYKANSDGYYGYSEVTVSGIGKATGKDPDGSGDDAQATVDPETGEIRIDKLPSSIRVETPPSVTQYADGATIDFSGMVVKAYTKSGALWTDGSHPNGIISIGELTLPVTHADASGVDGATASSSIVDGAVPTASSVKWKCAQIPVSGTGGRTHSTETEYSGLSMAAKKDPSREYVDVLYASATPGASVTMHRLNYWDDTGEYIDNSYSSIQVFLEYTYAGKTVYYGASGESAGWAISDLSLDGAPAMSGPVAWTIVYGDITGGTQTIPVQWMSSNGILESSFDITVT